MGPTPASRAAKEACGWRLAPTPLSASPSSRNTPSVKIGASTQPVKNSPNFGCAIISGNFCQNVAIPHGTDLGGGGEQCRRKQQTTISQILVGRFEKIQRATHSGW